MRERKKIIIKGINKREEKGEDGKEKLKTQKERGRILRKK